MCGFGALFIDNRQAVFGEFPVNFVECVDHACHIQDQSPVNGGEFATFGECGVDFLTAGA